VERDARPRAERPWGYELRSRIVGALERLAAECNRKQLIFAFSSSNRFHLVIAEDYQVYIAQKDAIPLGSFSTPLVELELDTSAIGLGDGAKRAALENAAQTALAKFGRAKRPWGYELRSRIGAALENLITECNRKQLIFAFSSSDRFHLVIDDHYQVYIAQKDAIPPGSFSAPLADLELDISAIALGGGAKRAALENAAQAALAKFGRPEWWVA
jgi:hypothetical protein